MKKKKKVCWRGGTDFCQFTLVGFRFKIGTAAKYLGHKTTIYAYVLEYSSNMHRVGNNPSYAIRIQQQHESSESAILILTRTCTTGCVLEGFQKDREKTCTIQKVIFTYELVVLMCLI